MPLYGLSGNLWPVHPHPHDDELLTSWLQRLAIGNGIKVQRLCDLSFGRESSVWNRDFDRSAPPELISRLAFVTGQSVERIEAATLRPYAGIIAPAVYQSTSSPWILPLGIYHRTRRRFGMQFCPRCLREDPDPYYRRIWRLAFMVQCPDHGCLLHDRCPRCEAPVIFQRIELGCRKLHRIAGTTVCFHCGLDLRQADLRYHPWADTSAMLNYLAMANFYWFGVNPTTVGLSSRHMVVFWTLRTMCNVILSRREHLERLGEALCERFVAIREVRSLGSRELEGLPTYARAILIEATLSVMTSWPEQLLGLLSEIDLTSGRLLHARSYDPIWREALSCLISRSSLPQPEGSLPVSNH